MNAHRVAGSVALGCALALAVAVPQAGATYRITGHGFGHGVGLAQYGAMGYARETTHTYRWILRQYFPDTSRATAPRARMRVRLMQGAATRVSMATVAVDALGRRVAIRGSSATASSPGVATGSR